jgi:hypothetical protein
MTKKLNTTQITNELAGSAFFRPQTQPEQPTETGAPPLSNQPLRQEGHPHQLPPDQPTARPDGEAVSRPDDRPTGKGILVRRGFEWREDQLRALKKLSLKEQMDGKQGSMSQMVRDALDDYLKKRAAEK